MKHRLTLLIATGLIFAAVLAACSPSAGEMDLSDDKAVAQDVAEGEAFMAPEEPMMEEMPAATQAAQPVAYSGGQSGVQSAGDRLIIKDAVMTLLVSDTDIAIERLTQVIGDMNGYTISSRIWYEDYLSEPYKYATFSIGVPVDNFEPTLQRLRNMSVQVLDEIASGEDVTDQFVDLQSRLDNLEATRDRIREFLDAATTVKEALEVNAQLSDVEAQIEEIQGRINYLSDRAAYSTITVTLEPELPDVPTPTPSPTPTATPTPTPIPWTASETFQDATRTVGNAYKGIANALIWFAIVVVPIIAPPAIILWLIARYIRQRSNAARRTDRSREE